MDWIKKNVLFVAGLAVALALLGGAIFYLMQAGSARDEAKALLDTKNQELEGLVTRPVYPNNDNVQTAKKEQDRVSKFIRDAKGRFGHFETVQGLDNASFKSLLETTISSLERDAALNGVKLPDDKFGFTFSEQRKQLQLPANSLPAFARQLSDIQDICDILFGAKIHSLVSLKRTGVSTNEGFGSTDILAGKKAGTNTVVGASIYPYEIVFQCFSAELGDVLEGFVRAADCYVVKTINVEPGTVVASAAPITAAPVAAPGAMGMDPVMAARYGMRSRYGLQPQMAQPVAAAAPTRPNEPVLDEKTLRITIGLEVIKLSPIAAEPTKRAPERTSE